LHSQKLNRFYSIHAVKQQQNFLLPVVASSRFLRLFLILFFCICIIITNLIFPLFVAGSPNSTEVYVNQRFSFTSGGPISLQQNSTLCVQANNNTDIAMA
jgi:hypothetical protein